MTLRMKPLADRPELTALLEKAKAAYEAMTPAQKQEMHAAQRKSWVIGNMMLDHPDMTREYIEEIYNRICF